jgi:putative phage-type endonuclease
MQNANQKKIRSILKKGHAGKYYDNDELPDIINTLIINIQKNVSDVDNSTITTFMAQYLHYSNKQDKYYFNLKKKQKKNIDDYINMLQSYDSVNDIDNEEDSEKIEEVLCEEIIINNSDSDSESDLNTEELEELEREFNEQFLPKNTDTFNTKMTEKKYKFPEEQKYTLTQKTDPQYGPFGTQWVHDTQMDDGLDNETKRLSKQFDVLRAIILPEQRSEEWFKMRTGKITASDGGAILGDNKYSLPFQFIMKKTVGIPFESSEACYHGTKLEEPATMIYEYRMNVKVEEFGLMGHSKYDFLGASPDGICSKWKHNGVHRSKYVGRMLEIKCPFRREIKTSGPIKGHICPLYYWDQVQLQLECCDLEECDFWQCTIREYESRDDFVEDTDPNEPFRSLEFGFEKGCLIQLLPKDKMQKVKDGGYKKWYKALNGRTKDYKGGYWDVVYSSSKFIYPPKINMSPYECDKWVTKTLTNLQFNTKWKNYVFDKVIYWRLEKSHSVTIKRDREWFAEKLPIYKEYWNYVLFLRENPKQMDLFKRYLNTKHEPAKTKSKRINEEIMKVVRKLYNTSAPNYDKYLIKLEEEIMDVEKNNLNINTDYEVDYEEEIIIPKRNLFR